MQTNESSVNYSMSVIRVMTSPQLLLLLGRRARALEAIGQTRDLCPELQELLILLGDLRALALVASGQIADLFPELFELVCLLLLCAKSLCAFATELFLQSLVTQLLVDELHGHTRHGHPRHFDTEQAVLYIGFSSFFTQKKNKLLYKYTPQSLAVGCLIV